MYNKTFLFQYYRKVQRLFQEKSCIQKWKHKILPINTCGINITNLEMNPFLCQLFGSFVLDSYQTVTKTSLFCKTNILLLNLAGINTYTPCQMIEIHESFAPDKKETRPDTYITHIGGSLPTYLVL